MISNKLPINAKLFLFGFNPEDDHYNKNERAIMIVFKEKNYINYFCQGDLPSPSDSRFYSRLLSTDDTEDVIDPDEYLLPYRGMGNHKDRPMVWTHTPIVV